jgi:hypothetical protein
MSVVASVRLPESLMKKIKMRARLEHRTVSNQINASLQLSVVAEENPDLPLQFIKDIFQARAEEEAGLAKPFEA